MRYMVSKVKSRLFRESRAVISRTRTITGRTNPKIFVVGRNKTGTTSLAAALELLGYHVGLQRPAELLMEDWSRRDFRKLIAYCHTADAFQDVPFSHDYTFQAMDLAFPGSKFILFIRDDENQWYKSVVRFHSKRFQQRNGEFRTPDWEEIGQDSYVYKGYLYNNQILVYGENVVEGDPWDEVRLKRHYLLHNTRVRDYFRNRPADLLELNVAQPNSMEKLCQFLDRPFTDQAMPRKNQSI